MPAIKITAGGKIITKSGKPSCMCCGDMVIFYSWDGKSTFNLDTQTRAFGESVGYLCGNGLMYLSWIEFDPLTNADEISRVSVDKAHGDGLWSSSYNIECFAGWRYPETVGGPSAIFVKYRGIMKATNISPGSQSGCASTSVAIITVYSSALGDGSFFEIT